MQVVWLAQSGFTGLITPETQYGQHLPFGKCFHFLSRTRNTDGRTIGHFNVEIGFAAGHAALPAGFQITLGGHPEAAVIIPDSEKNSRLGTSEIGTALPFRTGQLGTGDSS